MTTFVWLSNNYIEVFGALTGIIYVFLEIRQSIWLWPIGIITSAAYILIFFTGKFYADMSLQGYYLAISCIGWYWWVKGTGENKDMDKEKDGNNHKAELKVTRLKLSTAIILGVIVLVLFFAMWLVLSQLTDSPVPGWDSFITSLSIVATWMLARKIFEHWYIWIVVNTVSAILFLTRGLYPTVILYIVYFLMSFAGLVTWKKTIREDILTS